MRFDVIHGDALKTLRTLEDESVQMCVTSPPYWGLRDYGVAGQLGLEATPEVYVERMVEVFREVRRALKDDGTLWLNIGDSYYNGDKGGHPRSTTGKQVTNAGTVHGLAVNRLWQDGLKPKDMIGIPWMVAFALRADGWYLRSDMIWHKPNPMPESVTDRPTKSHEYLFLLSKSRTYFYDHEAIKEPASAGTHARYARVSERFHGGGVNDAALVGGRRRNGRTGERPGRIPGVNPKAALNAFGSKQNASFAAAVKDVVTSRNKRTVWSISTKPFKGAHFATFPPKLIEPCILAGSRPGDVVLDPFSGAGTSGIVANQYGRSYLGIELNKKYIAIAERRLAKTA